MKKTMVVSVSLSLLVLFAIQGCKPNTPSDPAVPAATATITNTTTITPTYSATPTATATPTSTQAVEYAWLSGNIVLPSGVDRSGNLFQVIIDDNTDFTDGITAMYTGICASGQSSPYSLTVPAGTYYSYALVKVFGSLEQPPVEGDYIGIYGTVFPAMPSGANVSCVNGASYNSINIAMREATNNISGTISMPGDVAGISMLLALDNDNDPSNGGISYITIFPVTTASMLYSYTALSVFPGQYYIFAMVDRSGGGLPDAPAAGDYVGVGGPFTISSDNSSGPASNGPFDFTLSQF